MKKLFFITVCVFASITLKAQISDSLKNDTAKFSPIDEVPEFPGGIKGLINYLDQNKRKPIDDDTQGRVIVSFIVERDGSLTEVKVKNSLSPDTDTEAVRLVKKMPNWKPGMQNNTPVRVAYSIPITF